MKKFVTYALLIALLTCSACSGGDGSADTTTNDTDTTPIQETDVDAETEDSRATVKDSLPDDLDFGGQSIRILYNDDGLATSGSAVNEIEGLEKAGDVVNDAVFQRNLVVEDRLNVALTPNAEQLSNSDYAAKVKKLIMAGEDAYDILSGAQFQFAQMALQDLFMDLADAPYLDYDQPWWADDYMNIATIHEGVRYMLMGDISQSMISNMSAMFYNRQVYENNFGDPDELYDTVLSGDWTMDKMRQYVETVYQDLDGDGVNDLGDVLGVATTNSSPTEHFYFCMGFQLSERDDEGFPQLMVDQSRNVDIAEAFYKMFFETPGSYIGAPSDIDDLIPTEFSSDRLLFFPARLSFASNAHLREMESDYGIIPHPKLNEEQADYKTLVYDAANTYVVPITCMNLEPVCATLEAMCAENYRTVTPAYFETALKVKYSRDLYSAQILDMIYEAATTDFLYVNTYSLSGSLGTISRVLAGYTGKTPSSDYVSTYTGMASATETSLEKVIAEYQKNK